MIKNKLGLLIGNLMHLNLSIGFNVIILIANAQDRKKNIVENTSLILDIFTTIRFVDISMLSEKE